MLARLEIMMYLGHRDWKAKPDLEVLGRRDKATISSRLTYLITTDPVTWRRVDTRTSVREKEREREIKGGGRERETGSNYLLP